MSSVAVAGIVTVSLVGLFVLVSTAIWCVCCMRNKRKTRRRMQDPASPTVIYTATSGGPVTYSQPTNQCSQNHFTNTYGTHASSQLEYRSSLPTDTPPLNIVAGKKAAYPANWTMPSYQQNLYHNPQPCDETFANMSQCGDEVELNNQSTDTNCKIQTGNNKNQGSSHHNEKANSLNEESDAVNRDGIKRYNDEKNKANAGTTSNADDTDVDGVNIDSIFGDDKTNKVQDVYTINDDKANSVFEDKTKGAFGEEEWIECNTEKTDNDRKNVEPSEGNCTNYNVCKKYDDTNIAHAGCIEDEHTESLCDVLNIIRN